MSTIQFTVDRMNEVHNRIGEIIEQLQTTLKADSDTLNAISTNIQSTEIQNILQSYGDSNVSKGEEIVTILKKMDEFLVSQMSAYVATDAEAQSTIAEVQGILNQIQ